MRLRYRFCLLFGIAFGEAFELLELPHLHDPVRRLEKKHTCERLEPMRFERPIAADDQTGATVG